MRTDNRKQQKISVSLPTERPRALQKKRALVLAALLGAILFANQESSTLLPRLCPWYNLTGIDCPFCGLTRSVIATADLHPIRAFWIHPFGPAVLALLSGWFFLCCLGLIRGERTLKISRRVGITAGAFFALGWLCWWLLSIIGG